MKTIILVLLLPAVALADGYLVRGQRLYVSRNAVDPPSWERIDQPGDWVVVDGRTPDPDDPDEPDDPTGTITERVAGRAKAINEPGVASSLADNYELMASVIRDRGVTFARALEVVKQLDLATFTTQKTAKRRLWDQLLAQLYSEINSEPQTAETLEAIAKGFRTSGAAQANNIWLAIITCVIEQLFPATEEPTPSPIPMPPRGRTSVVLPQAVIAYTSSVPDEIVQLRERLGWRK